MARKNSGLSFYQKKKKVNKVLINRVAKFIYWGLAMVLLAFVLVYCFGMRTSVIGSSMEPSLYNGQEILINRFSYFFSSPKKGDVVVFYPNGNKNTHMYVKRVIGTPGDTVLIQDGLIYIDGKIYEENGVYDKIVDGGIASGGITLGDEEYFVIGDNRNNSEDSRSSNIGIVKSDYIIGKAWYRMSKGGHKAGLIK